MKTIDKLLNKICLDERIQDGTFQMENDNHMDILQEYLERYGLTKEESDGIRNRMLEGKFPERQAYNKNGILVTFPTPEYKKRALERGTHFEKDLTKKEPNITFDGSTQTETPTKTQPTSPATPQSTNSKLTVDEPSKLSPSEITPTTQTAATGETPETPTSGTEIKPTTPTTDIVVPKPEPTVVTTTPQSVSSQTPIEPTKTPEQKKAEGEYVEKLLKTEITLDEAKLNGWKSTFQNQWYDKTGRIVGNTMFDDKSNKQVVRLI